MKTVGWKGIVLWALVLTVGAWLIAMWFERYFDLWNTAAITLVFVWAANTLQRMAETISNLTDRVGYLESQLEAHENAIRHIPRTDDPLARLGALDT